MPFTKLTWDQHFNINRVYLVIMAVFVGDEVRYLFMTVAPVQG